MTKADFIQEYAAELKRRYAWAADESRLARFLASVQETLSTAANTWNNEGEAVNAAWRAIGGKGKPTYKALRTLA